MKPRHLRPLAIALIVVCAVPAGCSKKADSAKPSTPSTAPAPPPAIPAASPQSASSPSTRTDDTPSWIAHPEITPGTISLSSVDPHDMTPSEKAYGRAPKLSPDVDYQPGVIVMEEGDKAIKSIASDGLTWTFDANAAHVSDFQTGKIIFATGRAVGKILGMTRNGDAVSVYLGPILLTDVIKRGRFVMDQPIDPDKIISYVAPDYPGTNDTTGELTTAMRDGLRSRGNETVVLSTASHGKWIPTSMSNTDVQGRRTTWRKNGRDWVLAGSRGGMQGIPSMPQGAPHAPSVPPLPIPPTRSINVDGGNVRVDAVANKAALGIQYYYTEPKSGLGAYAGGLVTLESPVVRCVLKISSAGVDSAGISIVGAASVRLRLDSHSSTTSAFINMHLKKVVPLDMSIQLGGPIPFSLTFAMLFNINSGFSANSSLMASEGEYRFAGAIWAGRAGGAWTFAAPHGVQAVTNLGQSLAGVSLGINSFTMAFGIRTQVGIGAFGFSTGVFAQVRFGGSLLIAPNEALPCRQATINTYLDTGLGYSMPRWAATVINLFLRAIAVQPIDAAGTLANGPSTEMFSGFDQIPTGCSTPKSGT